MFFNENKQKLNLKKIEALKKAHTLHRRGGEVVCTACQKPLTNEESMIAGMGPVCLERSRFAEVVPREQLSEIEGPKESISKGYYPARTVILRTKQESNPRYVTILSVDNNESVLIDRSEMHKFYQQTGSMAEAIAASLYMMDPAEGDSVATSTSPRNPDVMKEFKRFQKELRGVLKERNDYLKQNPVNNYYAQVVSKKGLTDDQLTNREWLLSQKDLNPNFFQENWSKGRFHRATWISRLKNTQLAEAKALSEAMEKNSNHNLAEVELKDYGLIDTEIASGLQHSNQVYEKMLFRSFMEGNKNLMVLVEFYKKQSSLELKDKMLSLKINNKITNQEALLPEEKSQYLKILSTLKIPSSLFAD